MKTITIYFESELVTVGAEETRDSLHLYDRRVGDDATGVLFRDTGSEDGCHVMISDGTNRPYPQIAFKEGKYTMLNREQMRTLADWLLKKAGQ